MTIILNQTRQERLKENLYSFIKTDSPTGLTIACADSDQGVISNGGRLGARWASKAILNQLVKMAAPKDCPYVYQESLCSQQIPFQEARLHQSSRLRELLARSQKLVHLGGGHDHVYSLMKAISGPIVVINIDAHLDTRADAWSHSGNPFREFSLTCSEDFKLFQLGIHPFANSLSTQQPLSSGQMHILSRKACDHEGEVWAFWNKIISNLQGDTTIIFSLDADALSVESVKAVSAPNHNGLSLEFLSRQMSFYKQICRDRGQKQIWGLYEFNPLYDDVSGSSARVVSGLIYEMLFGI